MLSDKLIIETAKSYIGNIKELFRAIRSDDLQEFELKVDGVKVARRTIKGLFRDNLALEVSDPKVRKILRDVRDDKDPLYTLNRLRELENVLIDDDGYVIIPQNHPVLARLIEENFSQIDPYDDFSRYPENDNKDPVLLLDNEYDVRGFYERQIEVGPFILSEAKSSQCLMGLFEKVRVCYAFKQYEAAIVFCRVLLEEALWNIYAEKARTKKKTRNLMLTNLMEAKSLNLNDKLKETITLVMDEADSLLHSGAFTDITIGRSIALEQIRNTIYVLEELF